MEMPVLMEGRLSFNNSGLLILLPGHSSKGHGNWLPDVFLNGWQGSLPRLIFTTNGDEQPDPNDFCGIGMATQRITCLCREGRFKNAVRTAPR